MIPSELYLAPIYLAAFALLLFCSASTPARSVTTDEMHEKFAVSASGKLVVDVDDGDVQISSHDADEVSVEVLRQVRADSEDLERRTLEAHEVRFEQEGDEVRITARTRRDAWPSRDIRQFDVRFIIRVPRRFDADLKTSDGDVKARDLHGDFKARSSDGDVFLEGLHGKIAIKTSDGDLHIDGGEGELQLKTSDGDIEIKAFKGPLSARTSDGNLHLLDLTKRFDAQTSDGDIEVSLSSTPDGDCRLQTSDGNIKLKVDETMALSFDCKVSDGHIDSDLTLAGNVKKKRWQGDFNGGGPLLTIRTSDGNISLGKK